MRRAFASVLFVTLGALPAAAQPLDPYGAPSKGDPYANRRPAPPPTPEPLPPSPPPAAATGDSVLAEQIAQSLALRAQELLDARVFADAKQLALEALATNPKGAAGDQARSVIRQANKALGVADTALPGDSIGVKVTAVEEPAPVLTASTPPRRESPGRSSREIATRVHGGLFFGTATAAFGALIANGSGEGSAAALFGLGGGVVGALAAPYLVDKIGWDEAQVRTVGSTAAWGSIVGMFFGDAVQTSGTEVVEVLGGGAIGDMVGALIGAGIASKHRFTRGDVVLVDTLAGIGTVGGLTLGMLMQPAEGEAYSVNALLGAAGGFLAGYVAAPLTNTTPRRMSRVIGLAALGAAIPMPFLLADPGNGDAEQAVGFFSTAGLLVGAYVGFRITRGMDEGLDVADKRKDDAPVALVGRSSDGSWALGAPAITPLSRALAPQAGMTLSIVGATF